MVTMWTYMCASHLPRRSVEVLCRESQGGLPLFLLRRASALRLAVAARVSHARAVAVHRWAAHAVRSNAAVPGQVLRSAPFRSPPRHLTRLIRAVDTGLLTGRGFDKCLRVAWTLADLTGQDRPGPAELDEALELRSRGAA